MFTAMTRPSPQQATLQTGVSLVSHISGGRKMFVDISANGARFYEHEVKPPNKRLAFYRYFKGCDDEKQSFIDMKILGKNNAKELLGRCGKRLLSANLERSEIDGHFCTEYPMIKKRNTRIFGMQAPSRRPGSVGTVLPRTLVELGMRSFRL